tara:strand:- start:12565 stop:13926 length:1362 start_codon:yes stop_codon:yes gene_type:complete
MAEKITTRQSLPASIEQVTVASNADEGKTVDLSTGVILLQYWESILQDGIRATVMYGDSGNTIDDKTAIDGLPIVGQERVQLKFTDNNEETLEMVLYVNKVKPFFDDSTKSAVALDLASKEFIMNEKVRVTKRYDGKISEHVKTILKDVLKVDEEKITDENIEETQNNYNFLGLNKKPYYMLNYLSKASVPSTQNSDGNTAGFLFFETSEGYQFKSIDTLLSQEKKKSIIYNETPDNGGKDIPEGYDMKALDFEKENAVDVKNKLRMGAYSTRTVVFDPFNCKYEVLNKEAKEVEEKEGIQTAGERLPVLNKEFDQEGKSKEFSRTMYMLLDTGSLPTGNAEKPVATTKEQLKKSKEQNYQAQKILAQSVMRYNQLFAAMNTITIAGDFSLHAGDAIFVDAPELQTDTSNDEVNKESGGLYIIADLCHYITPKETFTKLNLVRDTFGRKGKPT